jgi:hypothetical protein
MKKFYFLAFLATALLFGCTADGLFDGDMPLPSSPSQGSDQYCYISDYYGEECVKMGTGCIDNASDCADAGGNVVVKALCQALSVSISCDY